MWPKGDESKAYSLGVMTVILKGSDERGLRRYDWTISKLGGVGVWKRGSINGHDPKRRGPWDLIYRILVLAVGSRNEPKAG